jgi:hypothetical protein
LTSPAQLGISRQVREALVKHDTSSRNESESAAVSSPKPEKLKADPRRALISDPAARARFGNISIPTRGRWEDDPKVGWPKVACVIRGRNYYFLDEIEALFDRLVAKTASGEAKAVTPVGRLGRRRSPRTASGVVSG